MPAWLWSLVAACCYAAGGAIVPVLNSEAYLVGTQWARWSDLAPVVAGLALGNGVGKTALLVLLRQGRRLPWRRGAAVLDPREPVGADRGWRRRWRLVMQRALALTSHRRWGVVLVFVSAATSLPPLYPVTVVAAASRMRVGAFAVAASLGVGVRMSILGLLTARLIG